MTDLSKNPFIEVDKFQLPKSSMRVCGDCFFSKKLEGGNRIISILSDGLGSGIKASVLSTLCTSMFMQFASNEIDIEHSVKLIMEILPVCQTRKIAYSTFTIVDIRLFGESQIIEFDNPEVMLIRNGKLLNLKRKEIPTTLSNGRNAVIYHSKFTAKLDDRCLFFSDGISQSGIGGKLALGWRREDYVGFVLDKLKDNNTISAYSLAESLVLEAHRNDDFKAKDDISCGSVYLRSPRETLVLTGPPMNKSNDKQLGEIAKAATGKKIICGGTTASILSRELDLKISLNYKEALGNLPPTSSMKGFDLVCEGSFTLEKTLKHFLEPDKEEKTKLAKFLQDSDNISFVIGTRINDAHHAPNVPYELDIRRNIVKQLAHVLEKDYLKKVNIRYI